VQHLRDLIAALAWVYLANRRLKLSKKARKLSDKGIVVIAERFPLKHFWQMNSPMDGPKIRTNNNRVIGKLADIEQNFYEDIGLPGLVFVLKVDIEELRRRKNNMSFDLQSEKAYFVNSIQNNEKYCSIDANMPYEEVLLILKKELWRSLNKAY